MVTLIGPGYGHVSVSDSAKEFILVHALGRERLLVLSCFQIRLKVRFCPFERDRVCFVSVVYTPATTCAFNRGLICARHQSLAVE